MIVPTHLFVGPMKAGTSWIDQYLRWRGDILLPNEVKETFFFDRNFLNGIGWYEDRFHWSELQSPKAIVEVAPSLFANPVARARVKTTLNEPVIIFTLRDPIDRSWSHYQHLRKKGYTRKCLIDSVEEFPEIVNASRYDEQIAMWKKDIPDAQFHILDLDFLRENPSSYVQSICSILDLPLMTPISERIGGENEGTVPPSYSLARVGTVVANRLRSKGAYRIVNLAKRIGLKHAFYGSAASGKRYPLPTDLERDWLKFKINSADTGHNQTEPRTSYYGPK